MELILRSIPDLVISFDSSGKIGFVSQSVCKFFSFTPEELEGKSFWDRLCEDSVRLLKAAFMDALAARENESTSIFQSLGRKLLVRGKKVAKPGVQIDINQ